VSFFARLFEKKVADASALTYGALQMGPASKTGLNVNEMTALRVSAVYGCCRVIAEDIGKLPLKVMQEAPNGAKRMLFDHPLYRLLYRRPNEWQTSMEWRMTMMLHALLTHGGHSFINRGADGRVLELIPLMPHCVSPRQLSDFTLVYDVSDQAGHIATLGREQIHVLRGLSWNGYTALNLIVQGREAIGLALAAEETQARLHGNGAKPGGVLSTTATLTDVQIARLKEQFSENYSGVANAFKTLLLDNGLKFEPWSMTGVDGQHLETRKHQVEEICRLFRVFPQMIGASSATPTYASAESFFGAHVIHTLMPWVTLWEQAILRDLLTEGEVIQGIEAKFMMQALMRGSADQRAQYYESAISRAGWMTRNEARRLEDMDPLPGLDTILPPVGSTAPAPTKPVPPAPPAPPK
jgi:HK97 family phage portal protein